MKEKIKKYVDSLFADIYETKQLAELKEEINANLLEKVNDFIAKGNSEEIAFQKAIANVGDMSELLESLKKASQKKTEADSFQTFPLPKKQVIGYTLGSAIFLFGLMIGGLIYLKQQVLLTALMAFIPFFLVSTPIFLYFGLLQETQHHYGMSSKRALTYCIATELFLIGAFLTSIEYLQGKELWLLFSTFMPFLIISTVIFIYLGLTEKIRHKYSPAWEKEWVEYYSNPQAVIIRGSISGVLWIFTTAAYFIISFIWGWKYSWIIFIIATGIEVLLEAFFSTKRKKD